MADGSEFSVTEKYAKVCVSEGGHFQCYRRAEIAQRGPQLGMRTRFIYTKLALPDARHPLNVGPIHDGLPTGFRSRESGMLMASMFMPTANGAIVRGRTNAKTQKTSQINIRYIRRLISEMTKTCVVGEMAEAPCAFDGPAGGQRGHP